MNSEEKTKNQGTSKPKASHSENDSENGDMAWACCEELVELDDVQLATVVGGIEIDLGGFKLEIGEGELAEKDGHKGTIEITSWSLAPEKDGHKGTILLRNHELVP
jgi:hypothetical protein